MASKFGRYGLRGCSGLFVGGCFRVAAPYDCNGKVFVESESTDPDDCAPVWRRMSAKKAVREGRKIITCSMCNKPAVSLDHLWPYYRDMNRCKEHYGK